MSDDSDESDLEPSRIVIDVGTYWTKAGTAGEDRPSCIIPTMIATEINEQKQLSGKYIMDHGIIRDRHDMELLWHNIFENELKVDSSITPVLLTNASLNPKSHKETMMEIMFETFDVPSLYIGNSFNAYFFMNVSP